MDCFERSEAFRVSALLADRGDDLMQVQIDQFDTYCTRPADAARVMLAAAYKLVAADLRQAAERKMSGFNLLRQPPSAGAAQFPTLWPGGCDV